jgi:hypothetical protein
MQKKFTVKPRRYVAISDSATFGSNINDAKKFAHRMMANYVSSETAVGYRITKVNTKRVRNPNYHGKIGHAQRVVKGKPNTNFPWLVTPGHVQVEIFSIPVAVMNYANLEMATNQKTGYFIGFKPMGK